MCKTRKIEHEKPDEKPDPFEVMWSGVVPSTNSSFESVVLQQIANQSINEVEQDSQRLDCNNGKITDTFKNRGLADQKRSANFPMRKILSSLTKFMLVLISSSFNALEKIKKDREINRWNGNKGVVRSKLTSKHRYNNITQAFRAAVASAVTTKSTPRIRNNKN